MVNISGPKQRESSSSYISSLPHKLCQILMPRFMAEKWLHAVWPACWMQTQSPLPWKRCRGEGEEKTFCRVSPKQLFCRYRGRFYLSASMFWGEYFTCVIPGMAQWRETLPHKVLCEISISAAADCWLAHAKRLLCEEPRKRIDLQIHSLLIYLLSLALHSETGNHYWNRFGQHLTDPLALNLWKFRG